MAPNRKQLAIALDPLVDTQPLVQAKYLPLTAETASTTPAAPTTTTTVIRANHDSDDYWNWEAPSRDLFSAAHLEANLTRDAQRLANSTTVKSTTPSSDDYWAERVEARYSKANAAVSQATGYWDWPQDASAVQIALILKEEFARQQTSGARIEERLAQDDVKYYLDQTKAENDDYWMWQEPTIVHAKPCDVSESYWEWTVESEGVNPIAAILAYEKARSMLSAEHVQDLLVKSSADCSAAASNTTNEETDHYWNWPAPEDDYWNMRPLPVAPVEGYWDW